MSLGGWNAMACGRIYILFPFQEFLFIYGIRSLFYAMDGYDLLLGGLSRAISYLSTDHQ